MAPTLEYVFTLREYLHPDMADVGPRLSGPTRLIANVTGGFLKFNNSDIEAQIIPPGGDWPLIDYNTNIIHVDARARAKTDQGEIYLHYTGAVVLNEGMQKLLAKAPDAKATNFGDTTWFTNINAETTDQRLKWMETGMLVGQGRWHVDEKGLAAEYLVYKLNN
ncbi:hypothetical protein F4781DRAFT_220420 [Annulohypoxylon bovei var. microspora]|nr:hypothetical protein F4781DRAFT_220420 [Annulohypoxylon bovei var. microspora]